MKSQLYAERASLLARLGEIEKALTQYDGPAVKISTHRNIRNSGGITTAPALARNLGLVLVFADEALTRVADPADHGGWVCGEDAAELRVKGYSEYFE